MATSKNIVLFIYFLCLTEIVFSPRTGYKDRKCINKLKEIFGCEKGKRIADRDIIPRLAFKNKLYYMLFQEDEPVPSIAQMYFLHIQENLQAQTKMRTLKQWCDGHCKKSKYNSELCYNRLRQYFYDSNDTTEILKDAYSTLVVASFEGPEDYAHKYFFHVLKYLGHDNKFMTPREVCKGYTEAVIGTKRKYLSDSESEDEIEPSSSKSQKYDTTDDQE